MKTRLLPALVALASGVVLALSLPFVVPFVGFREVDPSGHLELLAWVALAPLFLVLERARSARAAAALGLVAGLGYFYLAIHWVNHAMTAFGGLPWSISILALTLLVLFMAAHWAGACAVAFRIRAGLGWPLWAVLPFTWVAFELLRNYLFTGFPWANLGYTQVRHLRVAQLAALFGVYAIAALVVLANAVLAEAIGRLRARGPLPWRPLAATAALLAAVVVHGEVRLRMVHARVEAAPKLKVGIVQPNIDQDVKNVAATEADYVLARLVPPTLAADRAGADLVVWPEAAYPWYVRPTRTDFSGPQLGLEPLSHAHLLLGASTLEWVRGPDGRRAPRLENATWLLTPDLKVLGRYAKHHLVPFGEYVPLQRYLPFLGKVVPSFASATPGGALTVLGFPLSGAAAGTGAPAAPGPEDGARERPLLASVGPAAGAAAPAPDGVARLAPLICYDAIFPEISAAFARQDPEPDFLVNPTNDAWYGYSSGPYQFLAIVRIRAIETGKAVVRPAYAGVSAIVLPTGEVAPGALEVGPVEPDRAPDPQLPAQLLLGEVPRLRGRTLYTTVGDLFAYACAVAAAGSLGAAWRAGRARRLARER